MSFHSTPFALAAALGLFGSSLAGATPMLIATGTLTGSTAGAGADLSGLTGTLENGAAANALGGIGSGLAWAGGNSFLAVPDRGPNATAYNAGVDDTSSYIARIQTISMTLTPSAGPLPFTLTPALTGTTLLYSASPLTYGSGSGLGLPGGAPAVNTASRSYFTGRSDNFNPALTSGNPNNARFDPEAIRVARGGTKVYVSDEYGPYVYEFDRATGQRTRAFTLPSNLDITTLSPVGATEISGNSVGRVANKGMEGLAITPDGTRLVGAMQAALEQDTGVLGGKMIRLVQIDIATGATKQFAYLLTTGSGVSEIVALNDHEFLVDERDGNGLGNGNNATIKQVFKIDLANAVDVTGMTSAQAAAVAVGTAGNPAKSLFLDIVNVLNVGNGIARSQIPAKIEGLAIGEDVIVGGVLTHTLWVANDNDFIPGTAGPNAFYVFGFTSADLAGSALTLQDIPEPASALFLATGLLGLLWGRRRQG